MTAESDGTFLLSRPASLSSRGAAARATYGGGATAESSMVEFSDGTGRRRFGRLNRKMMQHTNNAPTTDTMMMTMDSVPGPWCPCFRLPVGWRCGDGVGVRPGVDVRLEVWLPEPGADADADAEGVGDADAVGVNVYFPVWLNDAVGDADADGVGVGVDVDVVL